MFVRERTVSTMASAWLASTATVFMTHMHAKSQGQKVTEFKSQ